MTFDLIARDDHLCGKLNRLHIIDFGLAGGRTCRWKTCLCNTVCYAQKGRYDRHNAAYPAIYRRLTRVERTPAGRFYDAMLHPQGQHLHAFRVGRTGDCANTEQAEAVVRALETMGVPFMWPTRAWREPDGEQWKLLEKRLPKQISCSTDSYTWAAGERPPKGWPVSFIATPPDFCIPEGFLWCPHYPAPGAAVSAIVNCWECMRCYASPGDKTWRVNVAFALHSGKGAHKITRQHTDPATWPIYTMRQLSGMDEACGYMSSDGWVAEDDDA